MTPKTAQERLELTEILRNWQKLETVSIQRTTQVIEKTRNPLIRLVMEIIRHDSEMHFTVQQTILDSLEREAFSLTPTELAEIWDMVDTHAEMEKQTIGLAEKALENCHLLGQGMLLSYLITDEKKHDRLLEQLEGFKRSLYPYA